MHKHINIARSAVTAGLSLFVAMAGAPMPTIALADTGSVTITQQHNAGATYDAYMLFRADISEKNEATHIAWAPGGMKDVVLAFLDANGYKSWLQKAHPGDGQHDLAQNAAEYVAHQIAGPATGEDAAAMPRTPEGRSFATRLARELATKIPASKQTARSGETFSGEEGYWLFVTSDATSEASGEVGTAPLWLPLGGSVSTIVEKTAPPKVNKEVLEDSTGTWGKVADAHVMQDVSYRIVATLPDNVDAFDTYHLQLRDQLSDGLEVVVPSGKEIASQLDVRIGGQKVEVDGKNVTASYQGNVLAVDFADLLSDHWKELTIGRGTEVTVSYTAHMTPSAKIGTEGNANDVSLVYTDDPVSRSDGRIDQGPGTKVFAYRIRLLKRDGQTNEPLAGAKFTIQVADGSSDKASTAPYVQADGSLGKEAATFATGDDGTLTVSGIDEGTYIIREVQPPEGYEPIGDDVTLVVTSTLDQMAQKVEGIEAHVESDKDDIAKVTDVDKTTATIQLEVSNGRWLLMPLTGLSGISEEASAGVFVALFAGGWLAARRLRGKSAHTTL